jgi:hypothetical protein
VRTKIWHGAVVKRIFRIGTEMHESSPIRLSAFIGRSFLDSDKQIWNDLRDVLDTLRPIGFVFEHAKEAQLKAISEKVKEGISRNDIYIGVLTRRYPLMENLTFSERCRSLALPPKAKRWSTSEWIVEEIGYAVGKERPVILLIEDGVIFPTTDLDADTEWILFQRDKVAASYASLTTMIGNLIGQRIPTPDSTSVTTIDSLNPHPKPYNQPSHLRRK